jgi:hypothetical protein
MDALQLSTIFHILTATDVGIPYHGFYPVTPPQQGPSSHRVMQSHAKSCGVTWSHMQSCRVTWSHTESCEVMLSHGE